MEKIDLFREHREEYSLDPEPHLVTVGSGKYLSVTGTGRPADPEFQQKVGALYGCAYTIKFQSKARGHDFTVGALEGLWWTTQRGAAAFAAPGATWRWKLLIRVPSFVTEPALRRALAALKEKGRPTAAVKLESLREGRSVQALHVGPYADEPATLAKTDAFARAHRLRFRGKHHEIYLSDPRRVAAQRMRTILRHPVAR